MLAQSDLNSFRRLLLENLEGNQPSAVKSTARRMLLIAGAGSGKTEVMARRVAWWLLDGVPKDSIVAFTFTEKAAEEMKFRIRRYVEAITPDGQDATLGSMYIGTIHSFCIKMLKEVAPSDYHNYEVIDEIARYALVQQRFTDLLGLVGFQKKISQPKKHEVSKTRTSDQFLYAYDLLNEYNEMRVQLPDGAPPAAMGETEAAWCKQAKLLVDVGSSEIAQAFATSAARLYAYMKCRRFLDFSTCQSEAVRLLVENRDALESVRERITHVVVDELQDVNVVQDTLIRLLVGETGHLTAVGDHRQAIFGWRGGRVELMANLAGELADTSDGEVLELTHNFRSTPRVIEVSNKWNSSIGVPANLKSPDMLPGRKTRTDFDPSHIAALDFESRTEEAGWIARTINQLVVTPTQQGATHDTNDGERGIGYSDIAVLLRSSKDARTYMQELRANGIPSIVRAGPDLFSQPEVLLVVGALGLSAGFDKFYGGEDQKSLPSRIADTLDCPPEPIPVINAAAAQLRAEGVPLAADVEQRLISACKDIHARIAGSRLKSKDVQYLRTPSLREFLCKGKESLRRVFPQALLHDILAEIGLGQWDAKAGRSSLAMFHVGQLSTLVTGIETPGWTSTNGYPYQISSLLLWGTQKGRIEEAPLLTTPDAVQITTIHAAKGLEFPCVFVPDVVPWRFPSSKAKTPPTVPFDGAILGRIDPRKIADNDARDGERRLMYVALTRAERYLFVTSSKPSEYFETKKKSIHLGVADIIQTAGGSGPATDPANVPSQLRFRPSETSREQRLVTSFSDIRYFLECPHDFYLRKVLGFTPTINQAFGYGRGIHNLLREIHSESESWAAIATNRGALEARISELVEQGLFYLRHTVGKPAENMKKHAVRVVADYVEKYASELTRLRFEPEREFETLIEEAQVLVSGSIDLIRLDDPSRVTIVDFKSGHAESDARMSLDEDEMRLQITMYGLAARKELEYEADRGLVRYLGETEDGRTELPVDLDEQALTSARAVIVQSAQSIRDRDFDGGPLRGPRKPGSKTRCDECDFKGICGTNEAQNARARE